MRKILVAVVAIVVLAVSAFFVAPRGTADGQVGSASMGLDIFGITKRAGDMPAESYPAH